MSENTKYFSELGSARPVAMMTAEDPRYFVIDVKVIFGDLSTKEEMNDKVTVSPGSLNAPW